MAKLLNIFNSIADSNLAYYLLVIILLVVVVSMVYLIYTQNKEIRETRKEREEELIQSLSSSQEVDMVDDLVSEVEEEKKEEISPKIIEKEPILDKIKSDMEQRKANLILQDKHDDVELTEPIISEKKEELDLEKVEEVEDVSLSNEKKMEIIDATLTNIPRVSLLEETMTSIPPILEYSEETQELMNITKELESVPKERTIELTPYEEEQEQTAIISYDELVKQEGVLYDEVTTEDGLSIKKVDLKNTPDVNNDVTSDVPRETYAHEELFLSRLKSLQSKIN
jgi:hypothetical protein